MNSLNKVLSVAPLTASGVGAIEFVEAAAKAGFEHVGIRLKTPTPGPALEPEMADNRLRKRLIKCILDTRLKVLEIEAFWISPDFDIEFVKPAIETGALLEAKFVLVVGNDPDLSRFQINFSRLSELVRSHDMRIALEFIPYVAVNNLEMAVKTIHLSEDSDAGLLIDALHLARSGGRPVDLVGIPPEKFHFLHLCDATDESPKSLPELRREAREARLLPGLGSLPLQELLHSVPPGTPIEIECPTKANAHLSALEQLTLARQATLDVLENE
jgi:sugar phosphate isomerase/epimerase